MRKICFMEGMVAKCCKSTSHVMFSLQKAHKKSNHLVLPSGTDLSFTWKIIPVSKRLITMVNKSPK